MLSESPSFLTAGFFQSAIVPAAPAVNLDRLRAALQRNPPPPGTILVLPELWATGFVYKQLGELSRKTPWLLEQLSELAALHHIVLAGTLVERIDDERDVLLYNTLFFSGSNGLQGKIRKQHLFSFWREDEWLTPGDSPRPVTTASGLVGDWFVMTCVFQKQPKFNVSRARVFWLSLRNGLWRGLSSGAPCSRRGP